MKYLLVLVVALAMLASPGDLVFRSTHHTTVVACHDRPDAPC